MAEEKRTRKLLLACSAPSFMEINTELADYINTHPVHSSKVFVTIRRCVTNKEGNIVSECIYGARQPKMETITEAITSITIEVDVDEQV